MKLPKIFFRKLIIGAVLLAIATGMTAFIKESLDTQDPESALPIITVLYGDEELVPDKEVRRAGWEWNFFLTQEKTPLLSPEDVPLQPVDVMPGAQMRILFTKEPSELRVMRAVSDKPTEYLELSDAGGGRFPGEAVDVRSQGGSLRFLQSLGQQGAEHSREHVPGAALGHGGTAAAVHVETAVLSRHHGGCVL